EALRIVRLVGDQSGDAGGEGADVEPRVGDDTAPAGAEALPVHADAHAEGAHGPHPGDDDRIGLRDHGVLLVLLRHVTGRICWAKKCQSSASRLSTLSVCSTSPGPRTARNSLWASRQTGTSSSIRSRPLRVNVQMRP